MADKQGPAFAGNWTEMDPSAMMMTVHLGELGITKPDGTQVKWGLSMGGLGIIVTTDLATSTKGGVSKRRFIMPGADLVRQLAEGLLSEPDAGDEMEDRELHGEG